MYILHVLSAIEGRHKDSIGKMRGALFCSLDKVMLFTQVRRIRCGTSHNARDGLRTVMTGNENKAILVAGVAAAEQGIRLASITSTLRLLSSEGGEGAPYRLDIPRSVTLYSKLLVGLFSKR